MLSLHLSLLQMLLLLIVGLLLRCCRQTGAKRLTDDALRYRTGRIHPWPSCHLLRPLHLLGG
jgi:hypothetical protein